MPTDEQIEKWAKTEPVPIVFSAPPQPLGSLYKILDELVELVALAEEPDLADDERLAIAEQIDTYVGAQVVGRKADGICATLRECEARAYVASEESKRLAKQAEGWLARFQRIKGSTLRAMQDHGVKLIETPLNRLRLQNNGGKEPLEVYAAADVPVDLRRYELRLCGGDHVTLFSAIATSTLGKEEKTRLLRQLEAARWEPDGDAIRAALKGRVVCEKCGGILDVNTGCEVCNGTGTVPASVAGARLLERGVHLRVE